MLRVTKRCIYMQGFPQSFIMEVGHLAWNTSINIRLHFHKIIHLLPGKRSRGYISYIILLCRSSSTNYWSRDQSLRQTLTPASCVTVAFWVGRERKKDTARETVTESDEYQANQWLVLHSRLLVRVTWSAASWPPEQISAVSTPALIKHDPCSVPCL